MKIRVLPLLGLLCILSVLACNKSQETLPDSSFFFNCKIDGSDFTAHTDPLVSFGAHLMNKGEFFNIIGKDKDGNGFTIWLEGPLEEGTFMTQNLNASIQTSIYYEVIASYQNWNSTGNGGSGAVTIEKNHSNYLEGTFSFTGINATDGSLKVFTSGSFRAKKL